MLIGCCLVISSLAIAENQAKASYGLFLSPKSCLLSEKEKTCDLSLNISWKTPDSGNYCLYYSAENSTGLNNTIKCWIAKEKGEIELTISQSEALSFELRSQGAHKLIYTTEFQLFRKTARVRRKRRNPWSFY